MVLINVINEKLSLRVSMKTFFRINKIVNLHDIFTGYFMQIDISQKIKNLIFLKAF